MLTFFPWVVFTLQKGGQSIYSSCACTEPVTRYIFSCTSARVTRGTGIHVCFMLFFFFFFFGLGKDLDSNRRSLFLSCYFFHVISFYLSHFLSYNFVLFIEKSNKEVFNPVADGAVKCEWLTVPRALTCKTKCIPVFQQSFAFPE